MLDLKYYELRYILRLTDYSRIDKYLGEESGYSKKRYKTIDEFYAKSLELTLAEYRGHQSNWIDFHAFYSRYSQQRQELFDDPGVVNWVTEQNEKCGYCGISQKELHELVFLRGGNLTLNQKTKRSKGTLEIEKKDPTKGYTLENSILCCPLCNNAKSNLILAEDWKQYFVPSMQAFYKSILGYDIGN